MRRVTCASLFTLLLVPGILISVQAQSVFNAERVVAESNLLDQYFTDYELISLPSADIHRATQVNPEFFITSWVFPSGMAWTLAMESSNLLSQSLEIAVLNSKENRRRLPSKPTTNSFRSINPNQDARLSIGEDFIYGYVSHEGEDWYIEPANRFLPDIGVDVYLVYSSTAVIPMPGLRCGQTEKDRFSRSFSNGGNRSGCREVEVAIAADFSMYEHYGSAEAVFNHVEGVLNNISGNFDDEFEEQIQFRLTELVISACQDCDPWFTGQEAVTILQSFGDWGQTGGFVNTFDIGQFWSRRNYQSQGSGGIIGLAQVGAACTGNAFQILEDFIASAGLLRVMTAHEFGHSFGCVHNYNSGEYACYASARPDFIMDPGVSLSTTWTNGSLSYCDANSISRVNSFFDENSCTIGCSSPCGEVSGLVADFDATVPALSLHWQGNSATSWAVLLEELASGLVDTFYTLNPEMILSSEIELCSKYGVTVVASCDEDWSVRQRLLLNTEERSKLDLITAQPKRCDESNGTYALEMVVSHTETYEEGFTIWVAGESFPQSYDQSPQLIRLDDLRLPENGEVMIYAVPNLIGSNPCGEGLVLSTPDQACNLAEVEGFEDCRLPLGWHCSSNYPSGATWQIGDSTRNTVNFGTGQNSIDGSCMLYFDDDVLGPYSEQTGSTFVASSPYDLKGYERVELSLMYNFNTFFSGTQARFTIEVFDGEHWQLVYQDQSGEGCSPSEAWNGDCFTEWSQDLSAYANEQFRFRFGYDDGGQWAEFVALDNVMLEATKSVSALPVEWGNFEAKPIDNTVRLDWTTINEQNSTGFYVERSADGRIFQDLQFVASAGNSNQTQAYFHLDTRPLLGRSYYRLRQVDEDRTTSFSEIREVMFSSDVPTWGVFPNPVGTDGVVVIDNLQVGDIFETIDLLSVTGQLIERFSLSTVNQDIMIQLPTERMPAGIYLLRRSNGEVRKIVF